MCVYPNVSNKMAGKNFKIRRRLSCAVVLLFALNVCAGSENENDNDVLTLQDHLDLSDDPASDRRRPVNGQEKDILLLEALATRKVPHQSPYTTSSQEDESIMALLGKSKYFKSTIFFFLGEVPFRTLQIGERKWGFPVTKILKIP